MSIAIYVVLFIAIIGWIIWAVCTGATVKVAFAELGKTALLAGLIAFCFAVSGHVLKF